MVAKKPEIVLLTMQAGEEFIKKICAGIEEEGLLYRCEAFSSAERTNISAGALAYRAAMESTLGVGIGVCGDKATLTHESLGETKALCSAVSDEAISVQDTWTVVTPKMLGQNAARFVKKQPFLS